MNIVSLEIRNPHCMDTAGNRSLPGAAGAARGRRDEPARANLGCALILIGDWCASFEDRHPKPDDAGVQPSEFQRSGPAQTEAGARLKGKTPLGWKTIS
jgi:hypothetical protein